MPDIRDLLEGESRSVDLEPGDFERLLRRRERLQRNRRISGGVGGISVALVTGLVLARLLGAGGGGGGVYVPAAPVSPTSSPTVTPMAEGISFGPFGTSPSVTVLAGLPDGWEDDSDFGALSGPDPAGEAPPDVAVLFLTADSLYSDPCHWDVAGTGKATAGDVEVSSVDDLVAAVGENTFYTSTDPTPVTIDGYAGQQLKIQLPDDPFTDCDKDDPDDKGGHAYVFPQSVYVQGPSNVWDLTILDVDGTRVVAAVLSWPETSQDDLDVARNVVETMDIQI